MIADNEMTGSVPSELGRLKDLEVLNFCKYILFCQKLSVDAFFDKQINISLLFVADNNSFNDTIPTNIGILTKLNEAVLGKLSCCIVQVL